MKKVFLLLVLSLLIVTPTIVSLENVIRDVAGNSTELFFSITTFQITTNPTIGANVMYNTTINVTTAGAGGTWDLSNFTFYLSDNASTKLKTDFLLNGNVTFTPQNATSVTNATRNYVIFTVPELYLNGSANGSLITINWSLESPIAQTKIAAILAGRTYTETWNITSSASNLTIVNASLNVLPTYWHTRIGNPTVTFNSTSKNYVATVSNITVYTDLNVTSGTGNLLEYGSGWGTLSVVYNGPTIDSSSGSPSSTVASPSQEQVRSAIWWITLGVAVVLLIGVSVGGAYLINKKKY